MRTEIKVALVVGTVLTLGLLAYLATPSGGADTVPLANPDVAQPDSSDADEALGPRTTASRLTVSGGPTDQASRRSESSRSERNPRPLGTSGRSNLGSSTGGNSDRSGSSSRSNQSTSSSGLGADSSTSASRSTTPRSLSSGASTPRSSTARTSNPSSTTTTGGASGGASDSTGGASETRSATDPAASLSALRELMREQNRQREARSAGSDATPDGSSSASRTDTSNNRTRGSDQRSNSSRTETTQTPAQPARPLGGARATADGDEQLTPIGGRRGADGGRPQANRRPAADDGQAAGGGRQAAGGGRTYTVQRGDNLSRIAERVYGDRNLWRQIAAANPQIDNVDRVRVGQELRIPPAGTAARNQAGGDDRPLPQRANAGGANPPANRPAANAGNAQAAQLGPAAEPTAGRAYRIQPGDRLEWIARDAYGDRGAVWRIIDANPGLNADRIVAGRVIQLPAANGAAQRNPQAVDGVDRAFYVVERGDSLTKIARQVLKGRTTVDELWELNKDRLREKNRLPVGFRLKLPEGAVAPQQR